MKKVIFAVLAILVVAGGAGAYWYGNQPKLTYYPSGNVETSVERELYKENGEYKFFNEDGTLSQKYNVIDGVRNGHGMIYSGAVTAEVNYQNGELYGPLKLDTKGKAPELDNLDINFSGNEFTVKYNEAGKKSDDKTLSDFSAVIKGRLACGNDEFLSNMQSFLTVQNINTFKAFSSCVSITSGQIEDEIFKCEYKGAFQYPKFTSNTKLECVAKGDSEQLLSAMFVNAGITDLGKIVTSINYEPSNHKFSFNVVDDKGIYSQTQSFKGGEEIISAATEFAFSKQESKDIVKLASDVLKNFTITDSQLAINGKVVSAVRGEFNFIKGFSNPWTASFFGIENTITSQMKVTDKAVVMNVAYPISKKPLLSVGIQFDDVLKEKYTSFVDLVLKEFSENSEDVAAEHIMNKLPQYAMQVSDVVKSVNALLMNNKGEKVLGAVLNVKKGVDFMNVADDILKAFNIKIISYKNNKPNKVISGDTINGFIVEGKVVAPDEIVNYLDTAALDSVSKQIDKEYSEVYRLMQESKYPSDPFISGFYEGYYNASQLYKGTQVSKQVEQLALNIRTVYVDTDSYANLNNALAISLKTIPEDMLFSNQYIINASGGKVEISAAPAFDGDNNQSSFVLKFEGLSREACIAVSTSEFDGESGLIAMGVNKNVANLYLNESENLNSEKCNEEGILCEAEKQMTADEAGRVCRLTDNALYFKFQ